MSIEIDNNASGAEQSLGSMLLAFFWRPLWVKLWWISIPLFWLAIGEPTRPHFLDGFVDSVFGLIGIIIFTPLTLLAVQGTRFFRTAESAGISAPYEEYDALGRRLHPGRSAPWNDEYHPASGSAWMGNRLSDQIMHDHMNRNH